MHKKLLLGLIGTIIAGHAFAETTTQTIPTQSLLIQIFKPKSRRVHSVKTIVLLHTEQMPERRRKG